MYKGYNKVFWGIFFLTFHINLGPIRILPTFVAYLIVLSGIKILYQETQIDSFRKAEILAIILAIRSIIFGIVELISIDIGKFFIFNILIIIVFNTIEMIMFYKLMEGSIEYFNSANLEEVTRRNIGAVRFYIAVSTISIISINFVLVFNIELLGSLVAFLLIILRIYLMISVGRNRSIFAEK